LDLTDRLRWPPNVTMAYDAQPGSNQSVEVRPSLRRLRRRCPHRTRCKAWTKRDGVDHPGLC